MIMIPLICTYNLPIADIGECSVGVTVNVIGILDVPPDNIILISTNPSVSIAV